MNTTACFIKDRAASLAYEAIHFPATAQVSIAWLWRAAAYAEQNGPAELVESIHMAIQRATTHEDILKHFALSRLPLDNSKEAGHVPA